MTPPKPKLKHIPSLIPGVLNPVHQIRVMGRLIRRRAARPGTAPGTLTQITPTHPEEVRTNVIDYSPDHLREAPLTESDLEKAPTPGATGVTWIDVQGLHDLELIRKLGRRFSLHPLVLEDIVNVGQRPKMEEHEGYIYIVLPMLSLDRDSGTVREEQISMIVGERHVITLQERPGDDFGPIRDRIRVASARIRTLGPDYLAYALVDAVVDHYFAILETIGDAAEEIESHVIDRPGADTMHRLHALKREILVVRRAVWPVRDMVNNLARTESPLVAEATRVYLRDVYDHAIRIIDTVEVLRDVTSGTIDLYLSTLSQRTNEVMKTLTVVASIFIPLTFIAGVYGMNFDYMPELRWRLAYPIVMGLMALLGVGMLWIFRRRGWM